MNSILGADRCGFCNAAACVLTAMNGFSGFGFGTKNAAPCELIAMNGFSGLYLDAAPCELTAMNGFSGMKLDAAPCMLTGFDGFSGVGCFTTPCVLTEQVGILPELRTATRELTRISSGFISEEEKILKYYSTN